MKRLRNVAKAALERRGYVRAEGPAPAPEPEVADLEPEFLEAYERCRPYSMAGLERAYALWSAVRYAVDSGLPGSFVECGVWRGGSSMMAALALLSRGVRDRDLYLFDTFEGMAEPSERDVSAFGEEARAIWAEHQRDGRNDWCLADEDDVRRNMDLTGYPRDRVHLVPGRVEDTVPGGAPGEVAVLRLDTDWYESTAHELRHLYPRLSPGGVLIVDDYGHWQGARQAVDEYFGDGGPPILLNRIDYSARIAVKASA